MADGTRSLDLQGEAIERLDAALGLPPENVIPVQMAEDTTQFDPRVLVGATITTERGNKTETVSGTVRVLVSGTEEFVESNGTAGLTEIQGTVVDELTTHSPVWRANGLRRQEPIAYDPVPNRHVGAVETAHERTDLHPIHQS